jgi:IclR family pca regulon transcriptional regulator
LTLVDLGYARMEGGAFQLTARVMKLGYSYLSGLDLADIAEPHLERLSKALGESTSACVLDDTEIVYVARIAGPRIMTQGISVGTRFPAYATAMGRVLLAGLDPDEAAARLDRSDLKPLTPRTITDRTALLRELDGVRDQGYCLLNQELEAGLKSTAVPVRDETGAVVAAINVAMNAGLKAPVEERRELTDKVPLLSDAAAAIEKELGWRRGAADRRP